MIVFENDGLIDLNAVALMGVSVKSDSAIGYFGTGLKFAISTILRNNLRIELFVGKQKVIFFTEPIDIRDKQFQRVMMQIEDQPATALGFTTEMGKDWELWMAYRELYCNAKDENGNIYNAAEKTTIARDANKTRFFVYGAQFDIIHESRDEFILNRDKLYKDENVSIHRGQSNSIFYRGIKVGNLDKSSAFTYNIKSKLLLTEDRSVKNIYDTYSSISLSLVNCTDESILNTALFTGKGWLENGLMFYPSEKSTLFKQIVGEAALRFDVRLNPNARHSMKDFLEVALMKNGGITLTKLQQLQLDKAVRMLKELSFITDEYPIIVCDTLGEGILGRAYDSKIYIAKRCFDLGTKQVASTIFEEFVHLDTCHLDETRELQTYLFDRILTLGEEILSEPF